MSSKVTHAAAVFINETDPSQLYKLLNEYVDVKLKSGNKHVKGWVYTVDPVSMSVVLVSFLNGQPVDVQIINGEEVDRIEQVLVESSMSVNDQLSALFQTVTGRDDGQAVEYLEKRMHAMVEWMRNNHLPVRLEQVNRGGSDGSYAQRINILDSVYIRAPFTSETCESTNEIILDKVRLLINNFDQKP